MTRRALSETEKLDWLRLSRAENVGPITFRQLVRRYGSARAALDVLPVLAERGGKKSFKIPAPSLIENEMSRATKIGARFLFWCEPDYPESLAAIEDAPPVITLRGHLELLHKRCIGIVGARNASLNGRKMAETLARELGQSGIVIASGLARGIDTAAHQASLGTGTIAVTAGGVDVIYPQENTALYEQLVENGCVLSDMPLGVEPFSKLFPRRNRLISGLSLGLVVVEAALKSGSLITAKMALDQGREVFAVPGSPLDPRCTGTNDLIRQGAVLTEKAADILNHIHAAPRLLAEPAANDFDSAAAPINETALSAAREKIIESLSPSPVSVDELVRATHAPPSVVLTVLLELELAGRAERQAGNKVVLVG
ncbi:MAG: DNA-processing protein DprA [Alphaproteobacteria bacterium]|nr:DNA-processing protein DprA [Alphaproteobacteria bacterium]